MKPSILLLHGAIASQEQLISLASNLQSKMDVHSFDFCGHGKNAQGEDEVDMIYHAHEIIDYIKSNQLSNVHVFGYSMGGYAALVAAKIRPGLVESIITLGTKFDWTSETVIKETRMLDAEKMLEKVPQFVEHLKRIHSSNHWQTVLMQTKKMMEKLAQNPLLTIENANEITCKKLILVGEFDQTAGLDSSRQYAIAGNSNFQVLLNTAHPFDKVDLQILTETINAFALNKVDE